MSKEQWEKLTPVQQTQICLVELANMLNEAAKGIYYRPYNEETRVLNGNTTLISIRNDIVFGP